MSLGRKRHWLYSQKKGEETIMDKYIAKQIVLAQLASDGGKRQDDVLSRVSSLLPIGKVLQEGI